MGHSNRQFWQFADLVIFFFRWSFVFSYLTFAFYLGYGHSNTMIGYTWKGLFLDPAIYFVEFYLKFIINSPENCDVFLGRVFDNDYYLTYGFLLLFSIFIWLFGLWLCCFVEKLLNSYFIVKIFAYIPLLVIMLVAFICFLKYSKLLAFFWLLWIIIGLVILYFT